MSEYMHCFELANACTIAVLPFSLDQFVQDWSQLRFRMAREIPPEFSRDEWAYLIAFLDETNLKGIYLKSFGERLRSPTEKATTIIRPRGPIAIWLPNNVSLLGPLTLILLSLTGNPIRLKGGTQSQDLVSAFLYYALEHVSKGVLLNYLKDQVCCEVFGHNDPRNHEMAAIASMRIVFGSSSSAESIHSLPHPLESIAFSFVDRWSEAWIEKRAVHESVLQDLIRAFAIYGQAGCTSPRRVVMLEATIQEAIEVRDRMLDLWPRVVRQSPAMHLASNNVMASQWAQALGWDSRMVAQHAAVIAVGSIEMSPLEGSMTLMIAPASIDEAIAALPNNIQTLGYAFELSLGPNRLQALSRTGATRIVPIAKMHQFGPVWDGQAFWRQAFQEIDVQ